MLTKDIYVSPLNKAYEGPFNAEGAVAAAGAHIFISPKEAENVQEEIKTGAPGPWHFSYGFFSVSLQRGKPT
jgi:hypothetical protein